MHLPKWQLHYVLLNEWMMKTYVLLGLALFSLTLSYFFEKTSASPNPADSPAFRHAPGMTMVTGADFIELLTVSYEETDLETISFQDSLFYNQYAKTLGVNLTFTENKQLLKKVKEWIGTPYRYGDSSKKGTDCSGFVTRIYKEVYGIDLSRSSRSMFQDVTRVRKDQLQAGDLVFFRRSPKEPIYHVGIYLSDSKFVHSATNGGVMVNSLEETYYRKNFYSAGRIKG
jgi:probable lipoprotein NlpC